MVAVERVSHAADHFNPTGIQALTILDSLTFYRQVSRACSRDLRSAMLCLLLPKRCCCCCKLTRCTLVQANQVLKCEADTKVKITVGRCRWWGLHKFGVPIKMISLSSQSIPTSSVQERVRSFPLPHWASVLPLRLTHLCLRSGSANGEVLTCSSCHS